MDREELMRVVEWLQDKGCGVVAADKKAPFNITITTPLRETADSLNDPKAPLDRHRFSLNLEGSDVQAIVFNLETQGFNAAELNARELFKRVDPVDAEPIVYSEVSEQTASGFEPYVPDFEEEVTPKNSNKRVGMKKRG